MQPGVTNGLTATTTLTVTAASGVLFLPRQTLTFTFTPQLYQSVTVSYTNDFTAGTFIDPAVARINLAVNPGSSSTITLTKEQGWQTVLRRLLIQSLSGIVLTTVVPAFLFVLARMAAIRKADADELRETQQKQEVERRRLEEILDQLERTVVVIVDLDAAFDQRSTSGASCLF